MSAALEAQRILKEEIAPPIAGESMKVRIARAARRAGLTYARAHKFWYANGKVTGDELTALRAAASRENGHVEVGSQTRRDIREEMRELREQLCETRRQLDQIKEQLDGQFGRGDRKDTA